MLAACADKKPLTPEEQWHGYCRSMGNAARSILLDRQNGIEKVAAVEHADKITDQFTREFILKIINNVYDLSPDQIKTDPTESRESLRQKVTDECIATPHDKLPDYKPF